MTVEHASRIAGMVLTIAVLSLFFRHALFADSAATATVQVGAGLLMLWARVTFGSRSFRLSAAPTAGGVITHGPYRAIRHPIYASILLFVGAGLAAHPSVLNAGTVLLISGALAARIWAEERLLRQYYPGYADYAATKKRVIPFVL